MEAAHMNNQFTFGRYLPYDTLMHRLDPRAKIIAMCILLTTIFIVSSILIYILLTMFVAGLLIMSKCKLMSVIKTLKPFMFMMLFLLVLNSFFYKEGTLIFSVFSFSLYSEALFRTFYIFIRVILMISLTTILTSTTKPVDLTLAIEHLLGPLKRFKFPAHEVAMMISISLRFIPILMEETQRIMKAQASRGVDFDNAKLKTKINAMVSLIIPLFVSSFNRADELANAMEARGYQPQGTRTRFYELTWRVKDSVSLGLCCAVLAAVVAYGIFS